MTVPDSPIAPPHAPATTATKTVVCLLARATAAGITLRLDGDRLALRGPPGTREVGEAVLARKPEVIPLVQAQERAAGVLEQLRADLERVKHQQHGGQFPPALVNVVADCLATCESYVFGYYTELARRWNPDELLASCVRLSLRVARGEPHQPSPATPTM